MSTTVARTPAQARFDEIRDLLHEARRLRLKMCALLAAAERAEDWRELGYANMTEYVTDGLGLEQSTGAKMLAIGRAFSLNTATPMWEQLPQADQDDITIGSGYEAALMVSAGEWTPEEGIHGAAVHSPDKIRDMRLHRESFTHHACVCPHCGNEHVAPNEGPATSDDIPF